MNERIDDLIVLATLGELTDDEARELDDAVQADPAVAAELAAALEAAAAVQATVAEEPPPALRASVLDAIAGLPQQAPAGPDALGGAAPTARPAAAPARTASAEPTAPTAPTRPDAAADPGSRGLGADADATTPASTEASPAAPETGDGPSTEPPANVRAIGSARSRRGIGPWLAAAAAAVVVLVGAVVLLSDGDDAGVADEIAAVVEADDAVARSLSGEIGEIEVVYSAETDALVLTGDGIEPLPEGATYQAWLVADGAPASVGTFAPDPDGAIALRADGVDPTGAVVAVTVEPAGGSEQPTMPIVAQTT
jgi:anti-sigma-K factor RskA